MSDDEKIIPIERGRQPGAVVAVVGGVVDESKVTLTIHGEDLEPQQITDQLGVAASRAHRRGERPGRRSPPAKMGAWLLEETGSRPDGPEELLARLLARLPAPDAQIWRDLRDEYDVRIYFGVFLDGWNRGFGLRPDVVSQLARIGCDLEFDIYANSDAED